MTITLTGLLTKRGCPWAARRSPVVTGEHDPRVAQRAPSTGRWALNWERRTATAGHAAAVLGDLDLAVGDEPVRANGEQVRAYRTFRLCPHKSRQSVYSPTRSGPWGRNTRPARA